MSVDKKKIKKKYKESEKRGVRKMTDGFESDDEWVSLQGLRKT